MAALEENKRLGQERFSGVLEAVIELLTAAFPGSVVGVYLFDPESGTFILQHTNDDNKVLESAFAGKAVLDVSLPVGRNGAVGTAVLTSEQATQVFGSSRGKRREAALGHLLTSADELEGLLVVIPGPGSGEAANVTRIIDEAARIIQDRLEYDVEMEGLKSQRDFLAELARRTGRVDIASDFQALLGPFIQQIRDVLTFDKLTISTLAAEEGAGLRIDWSEGLDDGRKVGETYSAEKVLHGEAYRTGKTVNVGNTSDYSSAEGRFAPGDLADSPLMAFLGVPIRISNKVCGTLALESTSEEHFTEGDQTTLEAIAQAMGTALGWFQKYQETQAMASIDGLTQLLNHRAFMERLGEEIERGSRYNSISSLLILDIDKFKRVNDSYGHLFGDYVLRQIGKIIRSSIRKADIAGRYGGEEFGVIAVNSSKETSRVTAERIRKSIAGYHFRHDGARTRVTISIGMAEYPSDGSDSKALFECADQAMYMVKHQGGNAVIAYSPETEAFKGAE